MLNCEIHGAQDLRLTEVAPEALGPTQVRVGVKAVGICGSDLHYYRHGRVGDFVIREPLTPGHEASGQVLEGRGGDAGQARRPRGAGPGTHLRRVPLLPPGRFQPLRGRAFFGSASRYPHMQARCASRSWCRKVNACRCRTACPSSWRFGEPLAVALHAVRSAGTLLGKTAMVVGAGPIGALVVMRPGWPAPATSSRWTSSTRRWPPARGWAPRAPSTPPPIPARWTSWRRRAGTVDVFRGVRQLCRPGQLHRARARAAPSSRWARCPAAAPIARSTRPTGPRP